MIKVLTKTCLLLFFCHTGFSQTGGTDQSRYSLKHDLVVAKYDTSRVLIMTRLACAYLGFNLDSLNFYGNEALNLADQIHYPRGKARALNALALGIQVEGDYPKSFEYLYRSLEIAEERQYVLETAMIYSSIGSNYMYLGDFSKAIDNINKAQILLNAIINAPEAREWMQYNKSLLGLSYLDSQLDSSYTYALQFYETTLHDKFWHPVALNIFSNCLFRRGDHETSLTYARESISGANSNGDILTVAEACATMASFFKQLLRSDSAIYYAKKGLEAANSIEYGFGIYRTSKMLAEEYEESDVNKALYYRKIYDSVNESMYGARKVQDLQKTLAEEQHRQQLIQQEQIEKETRFKQYGYTASLAIVLLIASFLYRNNLQKKKANILLQHQKEKVESTLAKLKSAQAQLIQSEKMASLGELTAGIAHEIQNPLNFVNNFSEVSRELVTEMQDAIAEGEYQKADVIATDLSSNLEKINHHGKRADSIVKSMLQHSRGNSGQKEDTDINRLCEEYLRLAYHGIRAKEKDFNTTFDTDFDPNLPKANVIPQEIGRVILNLINNAFYAANEKMKAEKKRPETHYKPELILRTRNLGGKIEISVKDNGNGIPESIKDKIFQPFFTTKSTGQGTGLGLSLSYDIVRAHGGEIKVATREGEGSEFIIQLPLH